MSLSYLSKYRAQIMGLAATFIILCHTALEFSGTLSLIYHVYIVNLMQMGVDIFLLVSGLGCYFSFEKDPSCVSFYKKRLTRILVPYLIFVIIYGIFSCCVLKTNILDYLYFYSTVNFFISGNAGTWFVAAIIIFYLFFPLIHKLLNKNPKVIFIIAFIITALLLIPVGEMLPKSIQNVRELFLTRISSFLIGAWIGKQVYDKKNIQIKMSSCVIVLIISFIIYTINMRFNDSLFDKSTYARQLFLPIALSTTIIFANLYEKWNIEKYAINKFFLFFGSISFELYIVFERTTEFLVEYVPKIESISYSLFLIILNIISIIITIIVAIIVHKLSLIVFKLLKKQKQDTKCLNQSS